MKNFKTNAMLLTLGLLVSGSAIQADVMQEAKVLKERITTQGNNLFTPMNMFEAKNPYPTQWITLMKEVSAFVTPKTDMMSARLKTGLKECLNTSNYLTDNVIRYLANRSDLQERLSDAAILANSLKDASTPLIKAMNELQKETYRFSADKRAAKDVVVHLSEVLMKAVNKVIADAQNVTGAGVPAAPKVPNAAAVAAAVKAAAVNTGAGAPNDTNNNNPNSTKRKGTAETPDQIALKAKQKEMQGNLTELVAAKRAQMAEKAAAKQAAAVSQTNK